MRRDDPRRLARSRVARVGRRAAEGEVEPRSHPTLRELGRPREAVDHAADFGSGLSAELEHLRMGGDDVEHHGQAVSPREPESCERHAPLSLERHRTAAGERGVEPDLPDRVGGGGERIELRERLLDRCIVQLRERPRVEARAHAHAARAQGSRASKARRRVSRDDEAAHTGVLGSLHDGFAIGIEDLEVQMTMRIDELRWVFHRTRLACMLRFVMRLHHLALRTDDVDRLVAFYQDYFELAIVRDQRPRAVWLGLEGPAVLMIEIKAPDEPGIANGTMELMALTVSVEARRSLRQRLVDEGLLEVETQHTLYFRDPDGRRVGVSSYPLDPSPSGP